MRRGGASDGRALGYAALVVVVLTLFGTGLYGIDHGLHWDEWYEVVGTEAAIEQYTMADPPARDTSQGIYYGVYFIPGKLIVLDRALPRLPAAVSEISNDPHQPWDPERYPSLVSIREDALAHVAGPAFKIEARFIFLLFSCFAPLFVFLTVRDLMPGRYLTAASGAAVLALSFEVATHARWIAVDGTQAALMAFELWMLARVLRSSSRLAVASNVALAGLAAGMVLGCKATGLFAILPAVVAPMLARRTFPALRERVVLAAVAFALAIGMFMLLTPSAYLDPLRLWNTIGVTRADYSDRRLGNAVSGPAEHSLRFLSYFLFEVGSPFRPLAVVFAAVAGFGAWRLWRSQRWFTVLALCWVVPLLAVLLNQTLMVVRNYVQLTPLFAIAFAFGLSALHQNLRPLMRRAGAVALVVGFIGNAIWLGYAAWTIRTTTVDSILSDTSEYLLDQDHEVRVSPRLYRAIGPGLAAGFTCERRPDAEPSPDARVALYYRDSRAWRSNRLASIERVFAPRVVNFHFHTLWRGRFEETRTHVIPLDTATEMTLPLETYWSCQPSGSAP